MPATVAGETYGQVSIGPRPSSPETTDFDVETGRESLHCMLIRLYGEDIDRLLRRFETLRKKKAQVLCSLIFLLRCRDTNVIPRFLRQKRNFKTASSHRIYDRTERALLRERIHETRRNLSFIDKEMLQIHLQVSNSLRHYDWDVFDRLTHNSMMCITDRTTTRHKKKYSKCHDNTAQCGPKLDIGRVVVNLSRHQLTQEETSVLAKGGNFAITPTNLPVEDIIASIEPVIRKLQPDVAEEIRRDSARILQHAKPPVCNITNKEKSALKNLNGNMDIIIISADKGNATVIMNTEDYQQKIRDILNTDNYRPLPKDPTASILRKSNDLIKKSSIPSEEQRFLKISEALPPRLYGLPKIHKPDIPLRPIVSAINSPTYTLAKYLSKLLQPHIGNTERHIKDSSHFIEKLKGLRLKPDDLLVSFDVTSLFTMVPVQETLNFLAEYFPEDIVLLFKHTLTTTYFHWNGNVYEQTDGVAMGNPLSPIVANLYMEYFEDTALNSSRMKPTHWFRYVDDTFVVWSHGEHLLSDFLDHLNNIHPRIQFTMEMEKDKQLAFLDVLVNRNPDGSLGHKVYRKPTHTDRYLHKNSNHHPRQKRAMIKTLYDRAKRICEPDHLPEELQHLEEALQANGYKPSEVRRALHPKRKTDEQNHTEDTLLGTVFLPYVKRVTDRIGRLLARHRVKTVFKPTQQLRNILRSAKDPQDRMSLAGVYRIPCSCGSVYIGTTGRSFNTRLKEHKRNCRLGHTDKSAVADHALSGRGHDMRFEATDILSTSTHYYKRLQMEAIEIYKHKNNFNRKEEGEKLNSTWYPALRTTRTRQLTSTADVAQSGARTGGAPQSDASARTSPTSPFTINTGPRTAGASVNAALPTRTLRPRQQRH